MRNPGPSESCCCTTVVATRRTKAPAPNATAFRHQPSDRVTPAGTSDSGNGSGVAAPVRRQNNMPSIANPAANPTSRLAVTASDGSVST